MSEQLIYLLGGGGHGHVVIDALRSSGFRPAAIIDPRLVAGSREKGIPVLGSDEVLASLDHDQARLVLGIGANPSVKRRADIFRNAKAKGWTFVSVRHASAILGAGCELAEGYQIMAGSIIQPGTQFGLNVVINTGARIDHDCHFGDHAFISPSVTICGNVTIGSEVFVGAGAVIGPHIEIGRGALVGAGAVVLRSVAAGDFVAGNPATVKKRKRHV